MHYNINKTEGDNLLYAYMFKFRYCESEGMKRRERGKWKGEKALKTTGKGHFYLAPCASDGKLIALLCIPIHPYDSVLFVIYVSGNSSFNLHPSEFSNPPASAVTLS